MKNLLSIFLLMGLLFVLPSCDDYLDEQSPDAATSDQVWVSYDAAKQYMATVYAQMNFDSWKFHEVNYLIENFRSDDIFPQSGTTAWGYLRRIVGFGNTSAEWVPRQVWNSWYAGIKLSNDIIENVPSMTSISEDEKTELVAEARFLRAYLHFQILKNFHGTILRTATPKSQEDLQKGLSTDEEVYTQLEEDFRFAAENLPAKWASSDYGRATSSAGYAFLGKVHLFQKEWSEANAAFENVTGHNLVPGADYHKMFNGEAEVNSEVIFSYLFTHEQENVLYLMNNLGVAFAPDGFHGGWNMCIVSDYALNQYEAGDIRKAATVLEHGDMFDGSEAEFSNTDYKMVLKYVENREVITTNNSAVDYILMRYADVLLMQAEALSEIGGRDSDALALVNEIRQRAGLGTVSFSGEDLKAEIRKQRMLELLGEGKRFYDLVRWDMIASQLTMSGSPYEDAFKAKHERFPIPLSEVEKNKKVDPTEGF